MNGGPQPRARAHGPQGIYAAQMKDGSVGFTDDPNGLTNFGSGVNPNGPSAAGTQVHNFSNAGAYTSTPQQDTHVYGPNDGAPTSFVQQQNGMPQQLGVNADASAGLRRSMTGGGAPNASRAYAPNALGQSGDNLSPEAISSMYTFDLQALQQKLRGVNANDPEAAQANNAALASINARQQELAQGKNFGAAPTLFGGMGAGGAGPGGAGGALPVLKTLNDLHRTADIAQHNQNIDEHAASALDRQNADDASKAYVTAQNDPNNTTHAEDNVVIKHAPQAGMSRAQFEAWRASNEGKTNQADLMTSLRRSAKGTTHFWNRGDSADSSLNALTPAHFRFDGPGGSFAGMNNDPGDNAYPTTKIIGHDQYNQGLIDAYGKNYLQWMKDDAKNGR